MTTLLSDEFTDILVLDTALPILKFVWKAASSNMKHEAYKKRVTFWADTVLENKPYAVLVDTRQHLITIDIEMQAWFVKEIFPKYVAARIKKLAFIESEDFVSQISIEQTMDEDKNVPFKTAYFASESQALNWLLA